MNTALGPKQLALDLLSRSECKVQMAAVLTDARGRVFAWGWNVPCTATSTHAEIHALGRSNRKRLAGATCTVAGRRASSGNPVLSRPCEDTCLHVLRAVGIKRIEYHDKQMTWHAEKL